MSSKLPLILITGATGFLGSHIVQDVLKAGYSVRLTARTAKLSSLQTQYNNKERVEIIPIDDLANGDYTDALRDVYAVIHTAAALPGSQDPEGVINAALNGTLNILKQATAAGAKRFIYTSSLATVINWDDVDQQLSNYVYSEKDWFNGTKEKALDGSRDPFYIYATAKTLAERCVWKFAEEHPEIDITVLNPPYIYGPFADGMNLKGTLDSLSMRRFRDNVIPPIRVAAGDNITINNGSGVVSELHEPPTTVDVRDISRAHVLALSSPLTSDLQNNNNNGVKQRKRIIVSGQSFTWQDAITHLRLIRPDLRDRLLFPLPNVNSPRLDPDAHKDASADNTLARDILGMEIDSYVYWKRTVEDCVNAVLLAEECKL